MNALDFETAYAQRHFVRSWLLHAGFRDTGIRDVDDAVHEVYRRLWAGRDRYVPQTEAGLLPMLKRISTTVAIDSNRRASKRHELPLVPEIAGTTRNPYSTVETRAVLDDILGRLIPMHQRVLRLRYIYGYTHQQIAAACGLSKDQVYGTLKNAMQAAMRTAERYHREGQAPWIDGRSIRSTRRTAA